MNIEATIIVMVYKNLDQVRQTLDSIKKQTYSNYEVIVSDDGSPNYTQEDFDKITEQYKNEFTYFKLINNGINRGTVKHFNSLISQAKEQSFVLYQVEINFIMKILYKKL